MDLTNLIARIEATALGEWMRSSLKAMPVVESIHVMAIALLFGTILIVDLRLLGFANAHRAFTRVADELLRYTWFAFAVALITGAMMFTANASTYYVNTPFRLKLVALLSAGINMAVFQLVTAKSVAGWDRDPSRTPTAARVAGVLSILIWVTVIFLGRWIGFTKGYDFAIPEDLDFDFDQLLDFEF
jgi:hypothetical protein